MPQHLKTRRKTGCSTSTGYLPALCNLGDFTPPPVAMHRGNAKRLNVFLPSHRGTARYDVMSTLTSCLSSYALKGVLYGHCCTTLYNNLSQRRRHSAFSGDSQVHARKQTSQSDMSKERRVLQYVLQTASRGDPDSVLAAVDKYGREKEWNMSVGDEKGATLDRFVKERAPQTMLELGTYMGYSAIRMVRLLPQGAKFITVEVNQDNAAVAKEIIAFAGLQDRIIQVLAETAEVIPQLKSKFNVESFDMVFIDHWSDFYLRDIKLLEQNKLLRKGTVVVADNIIFPGAPDYADYVRTCGKYESTFHEGRNGKKPDGMEKSVYRG
ncbi:catechol O-methyltransferase-like [Branchiostoma floridae x Branchiostoma belcheri]